MKYIDAEKLIERLEEMKQAEYENCGGVNSKTGALQEVQELISSLQQEQSEPPSLIEKAIVWFNNIAESAKKLSAGNVTHLAPTIAGMAIRSAEFLEKRKQEQPEVDLEKAARHVYESWMGGTMDEARRDMDELGKVLNARKEK